LKAAGVAKQINEFLLFDDLRVALNKERKIDSFVDHPYKKLGCFRVLVKVVGGEHYQLNAGGLGSTEAGESCFYFLTSYLLSGDFDD
jgi:hypothetical protein